MLDKRYILLVIGFVLGGVAADAPPCSPDPSAECEPPTRLYGGVEYVFWWLREGRIPAILTTSSAASQGLLGQPDTRLLYGDSRLPTRHDDQFNGVRFNLGCWLDDEHSLAVEGNAFFLERDSTYFKAVSDGSTLLARVFFLPNADPASSILAGQTPTGLRNGGFVGYSRIELFGESANLAVPVYRNPFCQVTALCGVRLLQMRDRTDLTATGRSLPDQQTLFGLEDHYRTHNAYYGGQVGLRGALTWGRWVLKAQDEIGPGANDQQIQAWGNHTDQTPTAKSVLPTGLTVQSSNTGTFSRVAVNLVNEVAVNLGYQLTEHIQVFAGYTFLLWVGPVRSGDQIDLVVNPTPGTPPARPSIPFKEDIFWAQGVNGGLECSW